MSDTEHKTDADKKQMLKQLRKQRKESVARATAIMKKSKKDMKMVRGALSDGPATVPQIAGATGLFSDQVLWYVAAMKKYGEIQEAGKDGAYFQYALVGARETTETQEG